MRFTTPLCRVSTTIICRCSRGCWVAVGCARPGDCWRRVWTLASCGPPGEGPLEVPTPWQPVARRQLADPQDMSTTNGGGSGEGQLLDPVAQMLPAEPACQGAGGVCRSKRPVADQPHWPEHQR